MKIEKHLEALKEVMEEIDSALNSEKGLLKHQRRLALMISLGVAELIELYFHRLDIIKEGSRIKHDWFKKKDIKLILSNQLTSPIENVKNIDQILEICRQIEDKRNDLAYSSPLEEEDLLKEEINNFFEIRKLVEEVAGKIDL